MKKFFLFIIGVSGLLLMATFFSCKIAHRGANWDKRTIENTLGISTKSNIEDEYTRYEEEQSKIAAKKAAQDAMQKNLASQNGVADNGAATSYNTKKASGRFMKGDTLDWYLFPIGVRLNTQDAIGTNVGVAISVGIRKGDKVTLDEVQKKETLFYAPIGRYFATKTTTELDDKNKVKLQLLALVNKGILTKSAVKEVEYEFYEIK